MASMFRIGLFLLLSSALTSPAPVQGADYRVYVGTYTGPKSQGIYQFDFDSTTGTLSNRELSARTPSPSFLAIHPSGKFLYAANEVGNYEGKRTGFVSGFAIQPTSGLLEPINQQPSGGSDPCYVLVDPSGKNLLVANYSGGSLEVVPIAEGGKLEPPSCVIQHEGSSVDKGRQDGPHAHSIDLDASGKIAVSADLGLDKLMIYRLGPASGKLIPNARPYTTAIPGSGPRHFAFHPDGKHAFAINEMASTVTAFEYNPADGSLYATQTLSTRDQFGKNENSTAEILVHPSGKFVYGSNRGDNSLAIYSVNPSSGRLTLVGHQGTGGKTPRSFGIDPAGKFLIAANQDSGSLVVFKIDKASGMLKPVGAPVEVPSPVCVKFLRLKSE
jgi:6-phosphogluconolactonase